jgi:hypothetical protein
VGGCCPRDLLPPTGVGNFQGLIPFVALPDIFSSAFSGPGLLNLWDIIARALLKDTCFVPWAIAFLPCPPGLDVPVSAIFIVSLVQGDLRSLLGNFS